MIDDIVYILTNCANVAIVIADRIFTATGMWSLVFAGFSVVMICRFILGPILGFSYVGASDTSSSKPKGREKGYKVSQGRTRSGDSDGMLNSGFSRAGDL